MGFKIVLLNYASFSVTDMSFGWEHTFQNLYILFCIDGAFSDMLAAHARGTNVPTYHQRIRVLNCEMITGMMVFLLFSMKGCGFCVSKMNFKSRICLTTEQFLTLPQSILK